MKTPAISHFLAVSFGIGVQAGGVADVPDGFATQKYILLTATAPFFQFPDLFWSPSDSFILAQCPEQATSLNESSFLYRQTSGCMSTLIFMTG